MADSGTDPRSEQGQIESRVEPWVGSGVRFTHQSWTQGAVGSSSVHTLIPVFQLMSRAPGGTVLKCSAVQYLWVSWENGLLQVGAGQVVNQDVLLSYTVRTSAHSLTQRGLATTQFWGFHIGWAASKF